MHAGKTTGQHALPVETTGFVGREPELARLTALLGHARLVTVTGPGGVGKTRLALRAAARAAARFADGVCLADLSGVRGPYAEPAEPALPTPALPLPAVVTPALLSPAPATPGVWRPRWPPRSACLSGRGSPRSTRCSRTCATAICC